MTNQTKIKPSPKRVCVSVTGKTVKEAISMARQAEPHADVIEIRLDSLAKPEVEPFLSSLKKPLLFTNRPVREGGGFGGGEAERIEFLVEAARAGAAYVDIELQTEPELLNQFFKMTETAQSKIIISWHDFNGTASSQALATILQRQYRSGAHIGKIVTTANNFQDVLRVLDLQVAAAEIGFPLIAFCMGSAGIISRIATLELGGFMTYAAPDSGVAAAPGQLPVSTMRSILKSIADAA